MPGQTLRFEEPWGMKRLFMLMLLTVSVSAPAAETFTEHVEKTAVDAFDSEGLWILGVGGLATILAHQYDQQVREGAKDHQLMSSSMSKVGEFWGNGIPEVLTLAVQYRYDKEKSMAGFEGLIMGALAVQGMKFSVHRERPDRSERVSFPSGHTQAAFSLATSMMESYGWQKSVPFWVMGVWTGMSRIADDRHWLSDVTAGATLGILFGRSGFAHHSVVPTVYFENGRAQGGELSYRAEF